MKKTHTLVLFFIFKLVFTQSIAQQTITINRVESTLITNQGVNFIGKIKQPNNDFYVFDGFNNSALVTINGESFHLNNINFNVTTNNFESRLSRDNYFVYNNNSIDFVTINTKLFKKIDNVFYEVLVEFEGKFLLKKYLISFLKGADNRLVGTTNKAKPYIDSVYLIKIGEEFTTIELNKRFFEKYYSDKIDILNQFSDENNLSYKNEKEVSKIIEYMFTNS